MLSVQLATRDISPDCVGGRRRSGDSGQRARRLEQFVVELGAWLERFLQRVGSDSVVRVGLCATTEDHIGGGGGIWDHENKVQKVGDQQSMIQKKLAGAGRRESLKYYYCCCRMRLATNS